jgi:hypothetical protein
MKQAILGMALISAPLLADEVYLKGGGQISGEIVRQDATSVTIDIGAGTLGVQRSNVVRIEEGASPLQEYRTRAAAIPPGDAEAWRVLARWAGGQGLATQARDAWSKVVKILPADAEANRALGRVQMDGRWVSEEESYLARGFVKFEGEWMKPDERQAILATRQARAEADRQALDAQLRAQQQAAADQQARERAEHDAYWNNDFPESGDPVYWGWGSGALYWPSVPARGNRPQRPTTLPAGGRRR